MLGNLLAESVTTPNTRKQKVWNRVLLKQEKIGMQKRSLPLDSDHLPEENLLNVDSIQLCGQDHIGLR